MSSETHFEFIVIGTGAGGGPVAANLAKAGHRVLVLEAGGDGNNPRSRMRYAVPGASGRLDPELGWAFWVNSRRHAADRERQHFYVPGKGLYYPRGTSIGGSTTINSMITMYPDNDDWDQIAEMTGDDSWNHRAMRDHFQRIERVLYPTGPDLDRQRHGFDGWLPLEMVGTRRNLFRDPALTQYVVPRIRAERNGDRFDAAAQANEDFLVDPNRWDFVCDRETGLVDVPRSAQDGTRRGTRELLLSTAASHAQYLEIRTDCLATRLLFDDDDPTRVMGVEFLEGPHLYGASWLAEPFSSRPGRTCQAFASREVIVSGGAFNSPQLLMLSGIGPEEQLRRHGIPVRVPRAGVGRNLQDRLETGVVCKLPFTPNLHQGCTWGELGDPCMAPYEANAPDSSYRTRVSRQFYLIKKSSGRQVPNLALLGFVGRFRGYYDPARVPQAGRDEFTWFTLSGHTENRGGTVELRSADPRQTPEINFNYFEDGTDAEGHDLEALLEGVKMSRRLAAAGADGPAPGEISPGPDCLTDDELREFIKREAWGHHASCSNRIGRAEDPMAVVDSAFRVHGTKGLRVVDASVFPKIPGLFIVLPVFMIAEKASQVILADAQAGR